MIKRLAALARGLHGDLEDLLDLRLPDELRQPPGAQRTILTVSLRAVPRVS